MLTGPAELVGRDSELAALTDLLGSGRIVTIVGPGGVGKTALARTVVDRVASGQVRDTAYLPACYVVPLADVDDGDGVRALVARHLGLHDSGDRGLHAMLGAGDALVLLDNCEHVVDAAAAVAADLLEVPGLRLLVTSREPLSVVGEHVFALGPLEVPDDLEGSVDDSPAVRLFLQRSHAAGAPPVRPEERPDLLRLVRALDGLPLALELAAGRSRALSVHDLADRLDRGPDLLRSAARGVPERHRGAVEVVDWSYRLLDPDERRLYLALSVCAGGGDLAAVEALGSAVGIDAQRLPDVLGRLVAKSLVFRSTSRHGTRYEMLRVLRSFAGQRLAEDAALAQVVHDAHAEHFAARCDDFQEVVRRAWLPGTFDLLLGDFDNIRSAATWCVAHDSDPDRTFRLVAPLFYLIVEMGSAEIAALAAEALSRWSESAHPLASEVGGVLAEASIVLGREDAAKAAADAALAAAASPTGVALAHRALAQLAVDVDEALDHVQRCREAAASAGFRPLGQDAWSVAVRVLHAAGREEAARVLAADAMETSADNVYAHASVTQDLGLMLLDTDAATAHEYVEVSHDEWSALRCPYGLMLSVRARGTVATARDEPGAAAGWLLEALRRVRRMGYQGEQATTIATAVPLLAKAGQESVATALLAGLRASDAFVERLHAPLLEQVEESLTGGNDAAAARGRALGVTDLLDLAQQALRELRDGPPVAQAPEQVADRTTRELVRAGPLWRLTFDGTSVHLPGMKGLADLAILLRTPGREVPVLDLAEPTGSGAAARNGDLGERIDGQARAAYKERLRVLQAELDDADAAGDPERGAAAQREMDALTAELAAAYGLHGPRRTGDPAERARAAVTQRIRSALTKVTAVHPAAGEHLERAVATGRFCCYRPTDDGAWVVQA